jgi:hypothetical protein
VTLKAARLLAVQADLKIMSSCHNNSQLYETVLIKHAIIPNITKIKIPSRYHLQIRHSNLTLNLNVTKFTSNLDIKHTQQREALRSEAVVPKLFPQNNGLPPAGPSCFGNKKQ